MEEQPESGVCAQLHAIVLALCASIIAPFGGFFASGFKRSFRVKDFGNSIPGHGGMTDRMDCQVRSASSRPAQTVCQSRASSQRPGTLHRLRLRAGRALACAPGC